MTIRTTAQARTETAPATDAQALVLAIDCGNTTTRFCLLRELAVVGDWRRATDDRRTADEDMVWLSQLMALGGFRPNDIARVVIASVRPQSTFALRQLGTRLCARAPLVVGEGAVRLSVSHVLSQPQQVGADRLANARALLHLGQVPAIVVDFGTATTFDVIDGAGAYAGGVIAPGVHTSVEALYQAAAKLPRIDLMQNPPVRGLDTVSAMQSGVFWGYVGLVETIIFKLQDDINDKAPAHVVATGGLARLFDSAIAAFDDVNDDLTILGLGLVAQDYWDTDAPTP